MREAAPRADGLAEDLLIKRPIDCVCAARRLTGADDVVAITDRAGLIVCQMRCVACCTRWKRIG